MFNDDIVKSESLLYGFDPRLKIISLFLYSICLAFFKGFPVLFFSLFLSFILVYLSLLPFKEVLKRLLPVNVMIAFLWIFLPFTTVGEVVYIAGPLEVTRQGLVLASILTVKANAMMLLFIAFIASTPVNTAGHAMGKLGVPDKLVHLFFFTYRYLHVIYEEYLRLKTAMLIRGFVPKTNIHTYRSYAYLVGMLLVKSVDRAKRVHDAMLCRGFTGKFYSLNKFSMRTGDVVAFIIVLLLLVLMGGMEWFQVNRLSI